MQYIQIVFLFVCLSSCIADNYFPIHIPFYKLYDQGLQAYSEGSWEEAINKFEWALLQREHYKNSTILCLDKCKSEAQSCSIDVCQFPEHKSSYLLIRTFQCMTKCKGTKLRSMDYLHAKDYNQLPDHSSLLPFTSGSIYDFLQYCYYKIGDKENSTQTLRTFIIYESNNTRALGNLDYMYSLFEEGEVVPEPRKTVLYLSLFYRGWTAYGEEKWIECVDLLEESLQLLLVYLNKCTDMCEDAVAPISPVLIFSQQYQTLQLKSRLQCQYNCYLNSTHLEGDDDILFSLLFFLQFSYYKLRELSEAIIVAKTAQIVSPDNQNILQNLKFYSDQIGDAYSSLNPREEVTTLLSELEEVDSLRRTAIDILSTSYPPEPPDLSEQELAQDSQDFISGSRKVKPVILSPPTNLSQSRVLVDGFLSEVECRQLVLLASQLPTQGDGYSHATHGADSSPHTPFEKFSGVTLEAAVRGWETELVSQKLVLFYLQAAERTRAYLASFFQLSTPLYFSYTHLVCRSAKENENQEIRQDLSHPVHSDNCLLQSNGTCLKMPPAYTWRDYSSLVYLNEGFEGGDFFFADRRTLEPAVKVTTDRCGRMVGFSAGEENLHGVLPVTEGRRCALALWFTLDEKHRESWEGFQQRLGKVIHPTIL